MFFLVRNARFSRILLLASLSYKDKRPSSCMAIFLELHKMGRLVFTRGDGLYIYQVVVSKVF